jgi:hypothetical protein
MKIVVIHLMYHIPGKLHSFVDTDETVYLDKEEELKETLTKILLLMREPYKYDARIEFEDGAYFVLRSDGLAKFDKMISIRYSEAWNSHGAWERKTRADIKKSVMDAYKNRLTANQKMIKIGG